MYTHLHMVIGVGDAMELILHSKHTHTPRTHPLKQIRGSTFAAAPASLMHIYIWLGYVLYDTPISASERCMIIFCNFLGYTHTCTIELCSFRLPSRTTKNVTYRVASSIGPQVRMQTMCRAFPSSLQLFLCSAVNMPEIVYSPVCVPRHDNIISVFSLVMRDVCEWHALPASAHFSWTYGTRFS